MPAQQQRPSVHIVEEDAPGTNGAAYAAVPDDVREVRPAILHTPEEGAVARTPEQDRAYYQAAEPDILEGLFGAIEDAASSVAVCEYDRIRFPMKTPDGKPVLIDGIPQTQAMRVRFLKQSDRDIEAATRKATFLVPNPDVPGGPRVERTNQAKMRAWVIYNATVPEDRARFWDRPEIVNKLRAGNGVEVVERLLSAGETLQSINTIYGHSGLFRTESELDQVGKASDTQPGG